MYSNAVGAVKLIVHNDDVERASHVLAGEPVEELEDREAVETPQQDSSVCPVCGSVDFTRIPRLRLFLFAAVVLAGVGTAVGQSALALAAIISAGLILAATPSHRCSKCSERWDAGSVERLDAAPPDAADLVDDLCPRCASPEVHRIDYRRLKAIPMLFQPAAAFVIPIWFFMPKRQCDSCGLKL
jgi:hypothetical protein